jgi:hypothetical protein
MGIVYVQANGSVVIYGALSEDSILVELEVTYL